MAGLSGSADILLKIKADESDATRGINQTQSALAGLSGSAITNSAAFAALANPLALAGTAIVAIGAAAVTAAVGLFRLTQAASEYGSAIFDATEQTGLSAEAISSLKYAADTSGSSLEAITGSVAKFSTLLGQAANGNEKAATTLQRYGITATETEAALGQALETIANMTDSTQQSAAAADLFKDRTGKLLPVIKSFNGDLPGLIQNVKNLGIAMDDEAAQAADAFGDTLDTLTTQASGVGRQFATELMPLMTSAMQAISQAFIENKGVAAEWARSLINVMNGVAVIATGFGRAMDQTFQVLTLGLINNASSWVTWGAVLRGVLAAVTFGASEALYALAAVGAAQNADKAGANMGGGFNPGVTLADIPTGGGKGGGGGGGGAGKTGPDPAVEAERKRKEAVDEAQRVIAAQLEIYKAGYEERQALLESYLSRGEIFEIEKIRDTARIRLEALMDEKRLTEGLLTNDKINLNEEERREILQKIKVLMIEIRVEKLRGGTEINEQVKKEIADAEKRLQIERDILETERKRRNERRRQADQAVIDNDRTEQARLARNRESLGMGSSGGLSTDSILNSPGIRDNQAAVAGIEALSSAFSGLGQALGQVVSAYVLYGNAGTSVRKITAQILASLAQQAAVKAIFELAEGFAALALAFFGVPNAGPSASAHFAAAAIYGGIAGIAGGIGRGVAGNAFNESSGSGGSGGSGSDGESRSPLVFTNPFGGFNERLEKITNTVTDRLNKTEGMVAEAFGYLTGTLDSIPPENVLIKALGTGRGQDALMEGIAEGSTREGGQKTMQVATGLY